MPAFVFGKISLMKKIVLTLAFISLTLFQVKTSNIKETYSFTPSQVDLSIKRMNMFPPNMARIGHILETKKIVLLFERVIDNFFFAIDFREYFPSRLPSIFLPFFGVGLYFLVKEREQKKEIFLFFFLSLLLLTLLGPHAKYGPVILLPFLYYLTLLGALRILGVKKL